MAADLAAAEAVLRPDAAAALDAWRTLVQADSEQVRRLSERSLEGDYYRPITRAFAPNPQPSPELPVLEALALADDNWRDIGAGGGRLAIPLARLVRRLVAVEPSESQRETLRAAMAGEGGNIEVEDASWPPAEAGDVESVDVTLSAHAIYDTADLGPYLDAIERTTRRLCIAVLNDRARGWYWRDLFEAVHGERQAMLPALTEFIAVLGALGRRFEVRTVPAAVGDPITLDAALATARRFLWLTEGSEKDAILQRLIRERFLRPDGLVDAPPARRYLGIVTWEPGAAV